MAGKGSFVAVQNKEFLREKRMKIVEEKLGEAISEARMLGILYDEEGIDSLPENEKEISNV